MDAIRIERLSKTFDNGRKGLEEINLRVQPGEMIALIGTPGSGRSTLLRHIAGFVASDPQPSHVTIFGRPIQQNGRIAPEARSIRRDIGFVFPQLDVASRVAAETNVLIGALGRLPLWRPLRHRLAALFAHDERDRVPTPLLHTDEHAPPLAGEPQQHAAIARALAQPARLMLADEPRAPLDPEATRRVMNLLQHLNVEHRFTVLVSPRRAEFALQYCPRAIALRDGTIAYDGPSAALTPARLRQLVGTLPEPVETQPAPRHDATSPLFEANTGI